MRVCNCFGDSPIVAPYQGCSVDTTDGAFDRRSGKFKAIVAGTYLFNFNTWANQAEYADIMKGSQVILGDIGKSSGGSAISASGTVISRLEVGDEVYVRSEGSSQFFSDSGDKETQFFGFRLN